MGAHVFILLVVHAGFHGVRAHQYFLYCVGECNTCSTCSRPAFYLIRYCVCEAVSGSKGEEGIVSIENGSG